MKKAICFLLALSVIFSNAMPVFAQEVDNPQYGVLNVEYSDALGNIEQLEVMVNNDYVYADAVALSERLGYKCQQSGDLVSIFSENNFTYTSAPLLAVHFHINEAKVAYNPLFGAEFEYVTPAPCIVNEHGIWVPLRYTLVLLGANSTMVEDILLLQMPQNNVLSTAAMIINNEDNLSFDWINDFGYSETAINVADGAGRIVTLFSGLLEFDGAAWLSLIDWNAFDRKFGELLVTMCSTYSSDELEGMISQVETSLEVFSDDGKLGEILRKKQYIIDADVSEWGRECEKYLEMLEAGSGSPVKYNLLYQRYEKAMDQQELFAALGGDNMRYLQTELTSVTNVLDIAAILGSVVTYLNEFQQKDEYLFSSLKNYLNHRTETDYVPNATVQAMHHYLNVMDLGALGTSAYRLIEENWLKCIVDESGIDTFLGAPANVLLLAWDIMSETIPFYSKGLSAVENREISNYAQKVQNDALQNIKYLVSRLNKSSSISAEDCVQLSEYCYVYLKACYIARDAAIKSLDSTSEEFQKQAKGKLEAENQINRFVANNLAVLSNANLGNDCYILGFLTENNSEYLDKYSDITLLEAIHVNDINNQKRLTSVVTYQDNRKLEEFHFSYNELGQVVELMAYRYEGEEAIQWYTENYEYDSRSNLVLVKRSSSQEQYQYDYDANGQIKGYSFVWYEGEILSPESDNYILSYDDQGRIIEKRNEYGSDIQEYSYDESSNAVYAIREYGWADGHFLGKTTYDYTYAPLIIQTSTSESAEYGNSSGKSISFIPHWNLTIASRNIDDSCSFEADTTGCLLTVKDANGGNIYVCQYEENFNDAEQGKSNTLENRYAKDNISFSDIPSEFVFSSGVGGWGTYLTIEADGSFKGEYHDSDMGITGEGYPHGTVHICNFDGKFTEPQKVSEFIYSMKLESLNVNESAGVEYIENEIRYIVSEPYGMENADMFYIYLPGASMAELPEAFLSWTQIDRNIRDTLPSGYYGIYNAGGEKGFTATDDDCIWYGNYMYHYQDRKAALWPRYYGMSHLLFWPESGAAVIDLQFAWKNDNQTEFNAHDVHGSGEYHIAIDISDDLSTVNVSASSINGVDLSAWGGTTDGYFTAMFVDE